MKAGDRILFGKYSGSEIKIDGEELLIMREDEVLGNSGRRRKTRYESCVSGRIRTGEI